MDALPYLVSSRYGFDSDRCRAALKSCNGNIGVSLEHLLLQCFSEKFGDRMHITEAATQASMEECLEQRQEEALALCSIYGDRFVEKIRNKVWTVILDMAYLTDVLSKGKPGGSDTNNGPQSASVGICRYYLQGDCRFGARCKYKHESQPKQKTLPSVRDDAHLRLAPPVYELEVRFPEDNKYPYQPPLVAFYSTNEALPLACRLHIAELLYDKALLFSESHDSVIYALIVWLEEEETLLTNLLSKTSHKYSVPPLLLTSLPKPPSDVDRKAFPNSVYVPSQVSEGRYSVTKSLDREREREFSC